MQKITRNSLTFFAVALTVGAAVLFTTVQKKMSGDEKMMSHDSMKMAPEEMKMAAEHTDNMKATASEHSMGPASSDHMMGQGTMKDDKMKERPAQKM